MSPLIKQKPKYILTPKRALWLALLVVGFTGSTNFFLYLQNISNPLVILASHHARVAAVPQVLGSVSTNLSTAWQAADVGSAMPAGNLVDNGITYTVNGSGIDLYNTSDGFYFVYQQITGDATIVAHIQSVKYTSEWAQAGIMIRNSLSADSSHASMLVTPSGRAKFRTRSNPGSSTVSEGPGAGSITLPQWVKLVRQGNNFMGYRSDDGSNWILIGTANTSVTMDSTANIGFFVTSYVNNLLNTSVFDSVSISQSTSPPPVSTAPVINSFGASPSSITSGQSSTLSWNVAGASTLTISSGVGSVTGTSVAVAPAATTTYTLSAGNSAGTTTASVIVTVNPAGGGGAVSVPPQLPQIYLTTTMASTAVTGQSISLPASGDLQAAINNAQPGDEIVLAAGATYQAPAGGFILPAKSNPNSRWITIRSSGLSSLPESVRVSPAQASLMATVRTLNNNDGGFKTALSAGYYRISGIQIIAGPAVTGTSGLIIFGSGDPDQSSMALVAHHIILDRSYVHGNLGLNARCISLNSASTAIIDSYISECHGLGVEVQAIGNWSGPGPYKIVNNYLEASTENVIFGGDRVHIANMVASDIEFRRNYLNKPLSWNFKDQAHFAPLNGESVVWTTNASGCSGEDPGLPPRYINSSTGCIAKHWSVKNIFELKNAQRVLVDGNIMEGSWADGQQGWAFTLTPRNQYGDCPWCTVVDAIITNNTTRHVGTAFDILATDNNFLSGRVNRVKVANNLFEDINFSLGGGHAVVYLEGPQNIAFDHNTFFEQGVIAGVSASASQPLSAGFTFTNNITAPGSYGFHGDTGSEGSGVLSNFFAPPWNVTANALTGRAATYPTGNFYPSSITAVGFVNFNNGIGGDYHLSAASPYKNAGTDGKDLGADIDALLAAQQSGSTPPPTDSTAPVISITSPLAAAVLGGTTTLSASASDNVGVAAVQFKVDGTNVGTEVTAAPYSISWDTSNTINGTHIISATVRDTSGNNAAAAAVSVTVLHSSTLLPSIVSFDASPVSVTSGQSSTLSWNVSGATSIFIDQGIGTVAALGSVTVSPTITTTYTLTSTNSSGTVRGVVTVTVIGGSNRPPTGSLDGSDANRGVLSGWAEDTDDLSQPVTVHIYIDTNAGIAGAIPLKYTASEFRSDVGNHAFNFPVPIQYRDGQVHKAWVWALDLTDPVNNSQLSGSPISFSFQTNPGQICGPVPLGSFVACYYTDQTLGNLGLTRNEISIQYDWGSGSPFFEIPADHFSTQWIGNYAFSGGTYKFRVRSDDGARVYIDRSLVWSRWSNHAVSSYTFSKKISTGTHQVQIQYYENTGLASMKASWVKVK